MNKSDIEEIYFEFIKKKGLVTEWSQFFDEWQEKKKKEPKPEHCPMCLGMGEHVSGGSFGGPTHIHMCLHCGGTGIDPESKINKKKDEIISSNNRIEK